MSDFFQRQTNAKLRELETRGGLAKGSITVVSPLTVALHGSSTGVGAAALRTFRPAVGQVVWVWNRPGDPPLILGIASATPAMDVQTDVVTAGGFTLTTTLTAITGSSITVVNTGTYLVFATFDFSVTTSGVGVCVGEVYNSTAATRHARDAVYGPATTGRATVAQTDKITVTAGDILVLRAQKTINAGVAITNNSTTLTILECD